MYLQTCQEDDTWNRCTLRQKRKAQPILGDMLWEKQIQSVNNTEEVMSCHITVRSLSTLGKGHHWEAWKIPGETWTSGTLELAGTLKFGKSGPLLVKTWVPGGKSVSKHKNWKLEETFKIGHSPKYQYILHSFGHKNPQRCLWENTNSKPLLLSMTSDFNSLYLGLS